MSDSHARIWPPEVEELLELLRLQRAKDAAAAQLRAMVEPCALEKSEQVLAAIAAGDCESISIEELAAAIRLMQWLGESAWNDTGRGTPGNL